jgi:hypothetical protein
MKSAMLHGSRSSLRDRADICIHVNQVLAEEALANGVGDATLKGHAMAGIASPVAQLELRIRPILVARGRSIAQSNCSSSTSLG